MKNNLIALALGGLIAALAVVSWYLCGQTIYWRTMAANLQEQVLILELDLETTQNPYLIPALEALPLSPEMQREIAIIKWRHHERKIKEVKKCRK